MKRMFFYGTPCTYIRHQGSQNKKCTDALERIVELFSIANGHVKGECLQPDELSHTHKKQKAENAKIKQM